MKRLISFLLLLCDEKKGFMPATTAHTDGLHDQSTRVGGSRFAATGTGVFKSTVPRLAREERLLS